MKVLKHGKIVKRTCTCKICRAELEYDYTDTHIEQVSQNYSYNYISCPDCGFKIPVPFFYEVAEDVDKQ